MPTTLIPGGVSAPELKAHLAVPPTGSGPWPGVVVLFEAFGLTNDIRQITDRFGDAGYLALAPDLYTAGGAVRCLRSTFRSVFSGEGDAFGDIEAARAYLAADDRCTGRVGVVGFCLGGAFALLAASRGFDAAAPNYGVVPKDASLLDGACPIVASYGARDRAMRGSAENLRRLLVERQVEHDVKEYPDAGHSFLNRHNLGPLTVLEKIAGLSFHEPSAEDAWRRILTFFDKHLRNTDA